LHDEVLGTLELEKESLDLGEWLPHLLFPWRRAAGEKGLQWTENIPGDIAPVSADPVRLAQVVGNLASNAIKYTPVGGSVWVSVGTNDQQIYFRIRDSGPGVSEAERELIFEPFYRGEQGRKIKQGMGLGLSIARDILHAHGGEIELESKPGEGSQFTFWLPRTF
ncbi:MAG: sensor histidine kinase, partial [Anaerolineales bacterium]